MSAGSVSSNHSAPVEHAEMGWKEGHILKGLKRLQMRSPKEPSSLASGPHYKDCMTSNEGIYSLGVKCGPQGIITKQGVTMAKPFKAGAGVAALVSDSDEADDESPKYPAGESCGQPPEESLRLERPSLSTLGEVEERESPVDSNSQEEHVKLTGNPSQFLSPVSDNLFLEGPRLKPGVSPTESPSHMAALKNKNSLEKDKPTSLKKLNDRKNSQERSIDRKSRLDYVQMKQDRAVIKQVGAGPNDENIPIQYTATRALSWVSEARQRSSSMETPHSRDQTCQTSSDSKDYTILESPQRKRKPPACDSAKKAFILRSKSADGGPEQHKQLHSPLQQKLIKVHRFKGQSKVPGHDIPSTKSNLGKTPASGKGAVHKVEKDENIAVTRSLGSLESVGQSSPSSSPVKHAKGFKPTGLNECPKSPSKAPLLITKLPSSNDSGVECPISSNLLCSPLKQRQQEQDSDPSHSELRSPSPPPPPGRTTSLLIRPGYDSLPKAQNSVVPPKPSTTGKATASSAKPQSNQVSSVLQMQTQVTNTAKDNCHVAPQMGAEAIKSPKRIPSKVYHPQPSKLSSTISIPVQESQATDSTQSTMNRSVACHDDNGASFILTNQISLSLSQQGHGESQFSELVPQASSNVLYHGVNNPQNSVSMAVKTALPLNSKSHANETTPGQGSSTFLVLGRQNKGDTNIATKGVQTFETFSHQMIHGVNKAGAKDKSRRKIETRCSSLDSEPPTQPALADSGVMLDWGFDEEGWLFKRSVSVSTRPPFKPVMGMNGAKVRSQSFGARYMDRPNFNRSGKVRTQIKTHSGSSLNSLGDVFPGSMSCSSSYHCPMSRSLLNNFLIEEGLPTPSHLGSSSERLQSLKQQRELARRLQIEQQFSSAFGEPVSEEPERQNVISTIEEKVMLGIEENLHKSQEQERTSEAKQKSGSSLVNWFGFRKSKLPAPSGKKADPSKAKEEKREQKITSLLGGKPAKSDKKKERRKSDGKDR